MYKVKYERYAILGDGSIDNIDIGNIPQGQRFVYTDFDIDKIPAELTHWLSYRKIFPKILTIELVDGEILENIQEEVLTQKQE